MRLRVASRLTQGPSLRAGTSGARAGRGGARLGELESWSADRRLEIESWSDGEGSRSQVKIKYQATRTPSDAQHQSQVTTALSASHALTAHPSVDQSRPASPHV